MSETITGKSGWAMDVTIDPQIERDGHLASSVREATRLLIEEIGPSAGQARSEWRSSTDEKQRPLIDLTVSDRTGAVTYRFAPVELSNGPHMETRLHRLWGDLLMVRSHHQLDSTIWGLQQAGS